MRNLFVSINRERRKKKNMNIEIINNNNNTINTIPLGKQKNASFINNNNTEDDNNNNDFFVKATSGNKISKAKPNFILSTSINSPKNLLIIKKNKLNLKLLNRDMWWLKGESHHLYPERFFRPKILLIEKTVRSKTNNKTQLRNKNIIISKLILKYEANILNKSIELEQWILLIIISLQNLVIISFNLINLAIKIQLFVLVFTIYLLKIAFIFY